MLMPNRCRRHNISGGGSGSAVSGRSARKEASLPSGMAQAGFACSAAQYAVNLSPEMDAVAGNWVAERICFVTALARAVSDLNVRASTVASMKNFPISLLSICVENILNAFSRYWCAC